MPQFYINFGNPELARLCFQEGGRTPKVKYRTPAPSLFRNHTGYVHVKKLESVYLKRFFGIQRRGLFKSWGGLFLKYQQRKTTKNSYWFKYLVLLDWLYITHRPTYTNCVPLPHLSIICSLSLSLIKKTVSNFDNENLLDFYTSQI